MATQRANRIPQLLLQPLGLRIVVGVDGSPESLEAACQAEALAEPHAAITLFAAWVPTDGSAVEGRRHAEDAITRAQDTLVEKVVKTRIAHGSPAALLREEANAQFATLIAIGGSAHGRLRGIASGSTLTELAHTSPCPLLIARKAEEEFPRRIVVGVDGSPGSAAAHAVASAVAERSGAELRTVVALAGSPVDRAAVETIAGGGRIEVAEEPVEALVDASATADLVVVGSRCLSGLNAIRSVSERVAHDAHCSVLVVRTAGA